ncbi:MAG: RHS repeat-associated core domain-containing protein [Verrucomicrobiota bacterium JB023]|nr:RHS repeat-associated core domain-containing protein [Verrucomicrobiota bacterium JB023]
MKNNALVLLFSSLASLPSFAQTSPTPNYWLEYYGLESWELAIDHDSDGFTTEEEYYSGTDPFDQSSFLSLDIRTTPPDITLEWQSMTGSLYQVLGSEDMQSFAPLIDPVEGDGSLFQIDIGPDLQSSFYCLDALPPLDADNDGLSSVEEALLGTNPLLSDSDFDSIIDSDEVFLYRTDPLSPDVSGGTLRGTVLNDPNNDADLTDGTPLVGTTVYLDGNYNGSLDQGERTAVTDENGDYEFTLVPVGLHHVRQILPAPQTQTVPRPTAPPVVDGLPDEVVEYVHDNPDVPGFTGNLPVPYGKMATENPAIWGGRNARSLPEPVDPNIVLQPIGVRNTRIGNAPTNGAEVLTIPQDGHIILRFDEPIIDGPGPDLTLHSYVAAAGELANIEIGKTLDTLQFVERISETGGVFLLDLAENDIPGPIHYLKLTALDSGGTWFGFELTGVEVHNYARPDSAAHMVTITGDELVEDLDFGRYFEDLPPFLNIGYEDSNPTTPELRAGEDAIISIFMEDDLGIVETVVMANGEELLLNENNSASVPLDHPGLLLIEASATDTAGQVTERSLQVYITNADGSDPFVPNAIGTETNATPGAVTARILAPAAGTVLAEDTELVALIKGSSEIASWEIAYAPIDLVDPYALNTNESNYIEIASGSGSVFSEPAAMLPASSLADGIYLARIKAVSESGQIAYSAQVFAKNVPVTELRPQITIETPSNGDEVFLTADLTGTITSTRPLREWFVEYAHADEVDRNDLGSPSIPWTRIAEGTEPIESTDLIATFDATLLKSNDYILRVVAKNELGLGWAEPLALSAVGDAKLGRNRVEFTDVAIDLAGFPITFTRVYDSLQADEDGELGYGWSLDLQDPDIRETVPDTAASGPFGATPFQDGSRVYLTSPDGQRLGFTFKLENPRAVPGIGVAYQPVFEPDAGNYYELEVPETGQYAISKKADGTAYIFFINFPYNPNKYTLVSPEGNRFSYHEDKGFLKAEDPNGNTLTFSSEGIVHSAGLGLSFERDALGRIIGMSGPDGDTWLYTYDADGNLASSTDPDGYTTTYQYLTDPEHFLSGITDPLGRMPVRYEYDPDDGRLVAQIDSYGHRTEVDWDPSSFTGSVTSPRGFTTNLRYDERGNILEETDPAGNTTTYSYDDPSNPDLETSITDAKGNTWELSYNDMGLPTRIDPPNNPSGTRITRSYDEFGNITEARDINGAVGSFEYDENGNLTRQEPAFASAESYRNTPEGLIKEVIFNDFYSTYYDYSEDGLPAGVSDTFGYDTRITTDRRGRLTSATDENGNTSEFEFNNAGVPIRQEDFKGNVTTTTEVTYSEYLTTSPSGSKSCVVLDANGNPTESETRSGGTVTPVFDESGNLSSLTDALGNTTNYTYDFEERLLTTTNANGGTVTNTYDEVGLLATTTLASGKKTSFTYDAMGRLLTENWHDSDDAIIRTLSYTYHNNGYISSVSDTADGDTNLIEFFGSYEQPTREHVTYAGQTEFRVLYDWVDNGNRHSSPAGVSLNLGAARLNYIRSEYQGERTYRQTWSNSPAGSARLDFSYNPNGSVNNIIALTNGTNSGNLEDFVTRFTYDENSNTESICHETPEGGLLDPRAAFSYGFDTSNRIASIENSANTSTVSYDAADRLSSVENSDSSLPDESYSYDLLGNRTASHFTPSTHTIDTGNLMLSDGLFFYFYDDDCNVASRTSFATGQVTEFNYDHRNRLVEILVKADAASAPSTTIRYDYDFRDRLISREVNGLKTWIINDRLMPLGEFQDGESELSAAFFYSLDRVDDFHAAWRKDTGESWFLKDHIGSIRGRVDEDMNLLSWQDYDAFGRTLGTPDEESLGFASRFAVPAVGLYENRRRFYDPAQGRFLTADPLGYQGGDFNLYTYVRNLPLMLTDPTGESPAIGYGNLVKLILFYTKALCNYGNCVGTIYAGVVEGFIEKAPMANLPLNECVLPLLPVEPCALYESSGSKIGKLIGGKISPPVGYGVQVKSTIEACGKIDFQVDKIECGGGGSGE